MQKQVLNINAPQILDINVTQTSLLMTKRAIDLFSATYTEGDRAEKVKSVSRHDIANSLGFKIMVWNDGLYFFWLYLRISSGTNRLLVLSLGEMFE